jgi:hypothetical protein
VQQTAILDTICLDIIETEEVKIEEVSRVKYLGTIVTKDNLIEEGIKERIATGN